MCSFWDVWSGALLFQLTMCVVYPILRKMMAALPPAVEGMSVGWYTDATLLHPHPSMPGEQHTANRAVLCGVHSAVCVCSAQTLLCLTLVHR